MKEQWLQQHYYLPITGKPLCLFACERKDLKRIFNTNSEISQNRTEKQIMVFKTIVNRLFNDTWCYLVIGCFDWKNVIFQQTVVRVYYIFNLLFGKRLYTNRITSSYIQVSNIFTITGHNPELTLRLINNTRSKIFEISCYLIWSYF